MIVRSIFFSSNALFTTFNCNYFTHRISLSRRIIIPFEKNKIVSINKFAVFLIKKSVTNIFFSFSFDGSVLFSCSAGSAGFKKKERRRKHASSQIGSKFSKFVRYYYKTNRDFTPFRNIVVHLQAPISYFKLFMRSFISYYRSLFRFFRYRYNGQLFRYKRKSNILIRIYANVCNRLRFSLFKFELYKKKMQLTTFFFLHKCINLIQKTYNCNFLSFFKFFFYPDQYNSKSNAYVSNFSFNDFFFSRQRSLFCRVISNPPKQFIFSYLNKYLNIFYYFRHLRNIFSNSYYYSFNNSFFFSFLDNYYFLRNNLFFDSLKFFFFRVDSSSTKYSEYRNKKLNSYIRNSICNKLNMHFFFRPELSYVSFFFLRNLTIFSFFLKYSYLHTFFFSCYLHN